MVNSQHSSDLPEKLGEQQWQSVQGASGYLLFRANHCYLGNVTLFRLMISGEIWHFLVSPAKILRTGTPDEELLLVVASDNKLASYSLSGKIANGLQIRYRYQDRTRQLVVLAWREPIISCLPQLKQLMFTLPDNSAGLISQWFPMAKRFVYSRIVLRSPSPIDFNFSCQIPIEYGAAIWLPLDSGLALAGLYLPDDSPTAPRRGVWLASIIKEFRSDWQRRYP